MTNRRGGIVDGDADLPRGALHTALRASLDRSRDRPATGTTTRRSSRLDPASAVDDASFCRFEAETADDALGASDIAGVPFARIVAAEEIGIGPAEPDKKGNQS
jgi:hypothetical protein